MSVLFVSVKHSGNHSLFRAVGGRWARAHVDHRMADNQSRDSENFYRHAVPSEAGLIVRLTDYWQHVLIPLRDPRAVACSFHTRGLLHLMDEWRALSYIVEHIDNYLLCPVEDMPYTEMEEYLGRPVNRLEHRHGSIGDYPERALYEAGDHEALRHTVGNLYREAEWLIDNDPLAARYRQA